MKIPRLVWECNNLSLQYIDGMAEVAVHAKGGFVSIHVFHCHCDRHLSLFPLDNGPMAGLCLS